MRNLFFFCAAIFLLFGACKNDLELNANWKDITIVYGLLNQKDNVHYIKINKAYLGEGNALIMAQNPDSSTYNNNLEVRLEEWKNGQYNNKTLIFDTTTIYNKDSGTFYYPKQIIYKSDAKLDSSDNDIEYRLIITNKNTGKIISSQTKLIKKFRINKPLRNEGNPVVNFATRIPSVVEFTTSEDGNAMYYKVYYRFHYFEQDTVNMTSAIKYLDFYVGDAMYSNNTPTIKLSFQCKDFYSMLKSRIFYNPNMIRKIGFGEEIELIIYAADFNLYTYLQFAQASNGIVKDVREYTNIENGYGIFASRYYLKSGYHLSSASLDSVYFGSYTKDLGFIK